MHLAGIDWAIMVAYFGVTVAIGTFLSRSSGRDFSSFFLGGRRMPWWLLGISMVATTFATDTPNLVTDIVRSTGAYGNWTWWAFLLTGMLTVFVYAKLWRRSEVLTDIEFYEIRYSGRAAAFLRAFRAIYLGVFFNVIIMANVTLAAIKIGAVLMGLEPWHTVVVAATVTMIYSTLGGLTGILLTDLFQFVLAMAGSIGAALFVVNLPQVGGLEGLLAAPEVAPHLNFWPPFDRLSWSELLPVFLIPIAVQWWAAYYPGAEPGGGGFAAQRMLAAKNERHALGATFLFNIAHYALRPWPWILVALASIAVFPSLDAIHEQFPHLPEHIVRNDLAYPAMLTLLPAGLLGLVVASLAAAYMSTISTQVNWGASIIVNDVYRRFLRKDASERRLVWAGRASTVALMLIGCGLALILESALQGFEILLQIGAGTGLLLLLRWFWWRINAYSEIAAMLASFTVAVYFQFMGGETLESWQRLVIGVIITTICWLAATFLAPPTDDHVLRAFYNRIRPGGPGWRPVLDRARREGDLLDSGGGSDLPVGLLCAALGATGIYSLLFATGFFIYGREIGGLGFSALAAVAFLSIIRLWPKLHFLRP